jgi:copper homeostasis protein
MTLESGAPRKLPPGIELEVIACSVEDALAAWEGGATCLEVTVGLAEAGLTPPIELVRQITQRVPLPARIMVRERADFVLNGDSELEILKQLARAFADLHVDGLVVGYIRDGKLDLDAISQIAQAAPALHLTVHHAIEATNDPMKALADLRNFANLLWVDRVLVRGGAGDVRERIERLREYERSLGDGRRLIVGGGLKLDMLAPLRRATGLNAFHLGRAVRSPEEARGHVDSTKVARAVESLGA